MKKLNLLFWGLALFTALSFTACSSSDDDNTFKGGGNNPGGNSGPAPTAFTYAPLTGVVKSSGNPLEGVSVMSGAQELAKTDANGVFTLDKVPSANGRTVLKFRKAGYVDITRAFQKVDNDLWQVNMLHESQTNSSQTTTFNASVGGEVKVTKWVYDNSGSHQVDMKVALPKSFTDASGKAYTGDVKASLTYVSPDDNNFSETMPGGDLAAVRSDGSDAQLVSYGMAGVQLTDAKGNELKLTSGQEATVTFPVPVSMADKLHESIPLWSFDETTGLWKEEGEAKLNSERTAYIGKVKHFSWWNLDYPESRATLKVDVADTGGKKLKNVRINVDGQVTWWTGEDGHAEGYVPANTNFFVEASTDYGFRDHKDVNGLAPGTTETVTFQLQKVTEISGTVTVASGSKVCVVTLSCASGQIEVVTDLLGRYKMFVPSTYSGVATIMAKNGKGEESVQDLVLDEKDKVVNFTFKAAPSTQPSLGKLVLTTEDKTTLTYDFSAAATGLTATVHVVDSLLSLNYRVNMNGVERSFSFSLDNYDPNVSTYEAPMIIFQETIYDAAKAVYARTYLSGYYKNGNWTLASEGTLSITQSGDNMKFVISGVKMRYQIAEDKSGEYYKNPTTGDGYVSVELTAPVTMKASCYYNLTDVSKVKSKLPAFMPTLTGKKFHAMIIEKSEDMGKGAVICYVDTTITQADYDGLIAKAKASLGDEVRVAGMEETDDSQHHDHFGKTFYKDGKIMNISQNQWYQPQREGQDNSFRFDESYLWGESWQAKLSIRAYEGITVPVSSLLRY